MTKPLPPAIALMGPTASGKTGLAIELVERYPLDIISVDSALVYRGMDIGTAKPDPATLERAPHRLIDIRSPLERYSAADFREDALREMATVSAQGRVPLLVGGTMLYFRALFEGLSVLPPADENVRASIEARARARGWDALHRELADHDPIAAARINPNDPQRIQRALEVVELTGRPISEVQAEERSAPAPYRWLKLVVAPQDRAVLHERIAQRFDLMLEAGFAAELQGLRSLPGFAPDLPAFRAVGYRQGWPWVDGRETVDVFREKALAATRQLAKRQFTWLRREPDTLWYDLTAKTRSGAGSGRPSGGVADVVEAFLETPRGRSQMDQ
ncbi:MAG: tRNA (adenosine(37)-N6)-dimethylallyltransferase MiaA [Pseudomonadota bacterium]